MKKLRTVLAVMLVMACVLCGTAQAADNGKLGVTVDKTSLKPGDTVTVTLSINENPGITLIALKATFDSNVFEMVDSSKVICNLGDQLINNTDVKNEPAGEAGFDLGDDAPETNTNTVATGDLAQVTLKVKDNAQEGTYQIKVLNNEAWDIGLNSIAFDGDSVEVTVTHAHQLTKVSAKDATCTEAGNIEYWTCTCGKLFADEACTTEITEADTVIPAGHKLTAHEKVDPTCTEAGTAAYWTCDVCEKLFSDAEGATEINEPVEIPAKGHELTAHEAKGATCTAAGTEAHWSCDACGKLFSDAGGKNEIAEADIVIPAVPHTLTAHEKVDPTCTEAGTAAYWTCDVCEKLFSDAEGTTEIDAPAAIAALGHDRQEETLTEATCTEKGQVKVTCSRCDYEAVEDTDALGHTWDEGTVTKEATCTQEGEKTYTCKVCKETTTEKIALIEHTWDEGKVTKEATDTAKGEKTYTCTVCGATKTEAIPAKGTSGSDSQSGKKIPGTGDDSAIGLWAVLALSCAGALAVTVTGRKKRHN